MMNDFDLTDGIMALPWWPDQVILEVFDHWDTDDVYIDDDKDDNADDDTDDDNYDEAIWL